MPIEQGRVVMTVRIERWPPPGDREDFRHTEGDRHVVHTSHSNGRFSIWRIEGSEQPRLLFQSAPVRPAGLGEIQIEPWWDGQRAGVRINGDELPEFVPNGPTIDVAIRPAFEPTVRAIDHPDAATSCADWVQRRRGKFASHPVRPGKRPKTPDEQADELYVALNNLAQIRQAILAGRDAHLGFLAALLRSLLHWTKDAARDPNYSPLLLRLASWSELPLPVYDDGIVALPPAGSNPPVGPGQPTPFSPPMFELTPRVWSVVDLQQMLTKEAFYVAIPQPDGNLLGKRLSAKEIIFDFATSLGISHFDEDTPEFVDSLGGISVARLGIIPLSLCQTAATVVELGAWVLGELASRGLIAPPVHMPGPDTSQQSPPPQMA